jgi:formylglycine-generating enzyme required for sulfatase activity
MLENIWEHLDESPPPIDLTSAESTSPVDLAMESSLPIEREPSSESLLKRSSQSALEHLKKASLKRTPLTESRSSPRTLTGLGETDALQSTPGSTDTEAALDRVQPIAGSRLVHWARVLLAICAVSGLSGIGLLSYEYYHTLQEQRQREAAALQRQQEEAATRLVQEETRQREAEFAKHLEQARKAIADRAWDRASLLLDRAAALDSSHPALDAARTELFDARNPGAMVKTRTDPITGLELNRIEGGCFNMGSPPTERDRSSDESVHQACVKDFWIGKTEVTNSQFRRFKPTHNSGSLQGRVLNGDTQPAVNLSWDDAQAFVEWLNWETGSGKRFRLPTEAEWEYAARAGAITRYYWGNEIDPRYANFSDRNDPTGASVSNLDDGQSVTAPVGTYLPNALGLHDMAGNVWEWTCSEYQPNYGGEEQRCSAKRANEGQRTVRGGSWNNGPGELRSAKRLPRKPGDRDALTGFRVVMEE